MQWLYKGPSKPLPWQGVSFLTRGATKPWAMVSQHLGSIRNIIFGSAVYRCLEAAGMWSANVTSYYISSYHHGVTAEGSDTCLCTEATTSVS